MVKKAMFFRADNNGSASIEPLMECCRNEQFEIEDRGQAPDHETIRAMLPETPVLLFVPAIEQDCLGVKLAQDAIEERLPRVIVLHTSSMPSREYLCLAFREGVDDIIALDSDPETLAVKIKRADRMLQAKLSSADTGSQLIRENEALHSRCEQLELRDARWRERLLALSLTATKMATGDLRLAENGACLLIVAASNSQAASAEELAQRLGFDPKIVHNGEEALKRIKKCPPQVILTDGTLTDMDARAFAPAARKVLGNKPVIIIAWSSSPESEEDFLAPDAGMDDFVLKSTSSEGTGLLAAALLGGFRI